MIAVALALCGAGCLTAAGGERKMIELPDPLLAEAYEKAAKQNVLAAVKGGPAAVLAGALAVGVSFALVPVISRIGEPKAAKPDPSQGEEAP